VTAALAEDLDVSGLPVVVRRTGRAVDPEWNELFIGLRAYNERPPKPSVVCWWSSTFGRGPR
jgi:hypothetical protein